jgi:hypothetical protein
MDRPESGKQYRLTGGPGTPAISNGNTWAESAVLEADDAVIFRYTNEQAIADGIKVVLGDRLFATTNLAVTLAPSDDPDVVFDAGVLRAKLARLLKCFNEGVYADPSEADQYKEADASLALYDVDGVRVWAILDGEGLTLLLPEDY